VYTEHLHASRDNKEVINSATVTTGRMKYKSNGFTYRIALTPWRTALLEKLIVV
jgi:hypothetical protein